MTRQHSIRNQNGNIIRSQNEGKGELSYTKNQSIHLKHTMYCYFGGKIENISFISHKSKMALLGTFSKKLCVLKETYIRVL